uniref:Uncharacterized protein n=1 Tax=Anguilla anguilla TaxID=7936 RepID=A0A0E9TJF9_ANGAN
MRNRFYKKYQVKPFRNYNLIKVLRST